MQVFDGQDKIGVARVVGNSDNTPIASANALDKIVTQTAQLYDKVWQQRHVHFVRASEKRRINQVARYIYSRKVA
jgi:hypothetical protein